MQAYFALLKQIEESAAWIEANSDKCLWYTYDYTDDNGVKSKTRIIHPTYGYSLSYLPISNDDYYLVCYHFDDKGRISGNYLCKDKINRSSILDNEKSHKHLLTSDNYWAQAWLGHSVSSFPRTFSIGVTTTYPTTNPNTAAMVSFSSDCTRVWVWLRDNPEHKEYYKLVDPYEFIPKIDYLYE